MAGVAVNGQLLAPTITSVTVTSLPATPAGNNNMGDVDVVSVPPITGEVDQQPRPSSTSTAVAQTTQGTTAAQILAANGTRKGFFIQNTGTTIIKLGLGATPTATAYHVALKASTAADDGSGGFYADNQWKGAVQAISSAAGGTLVVTELT